MSIIPKKDMTCPLEDSRRASKADFETTIYDRPRGGVACVAAKCICRCRNDDFIYICERFEYRIQAKGYTDRAVDLDTKGASIGCDCSLRNQEMQGRD